MKNIILILFCIPIFLFSQDCILPNGKYNVIPGEKFNYYPEYELEIKKDSAIIKKNNQINYYKIINEFCSFRFESFEPPDESGWTELEKILNK